MTPERLEGMRIRAQHGFDKNQYMPFGPGDVLDLIAEIQRLQAEILTPAKEPSGEVGKAVEALENIEEMLTACPSDPDPVHFSEAARKIALNALAAYRAQVTRWK